MPRKLDTVETDGLVKFTERHGIVEAAQRLGVHENTLRRELRHRGIKREVYTPDALNEDALREIRELCA